MRPTKKVLIFKHSRTWSGDRCSAWFESNGYQVEWCYPCEGQSLPDPDRFAAAVIFGGRNSANDREAWIAEEHRWIERCLKSDCHFLGICLGGQILARVLGAEVSTHADNLTEIGFVDIVPSEHAGECQSLPLKLFQWHREGFELPSDSTLLCSSERFPNQAFRHNSNVYGLQFHPEVNHSVIRQWFARNTDYESEGLDAASRARHLDYAKRNDDSITDWFSGFLGRWLEKT